VSEFGTLLRRHRENARLTQEELAERSGVSARTISDIERGARSRAYTDTAKRLNSALALSGNDGATFLESARGRPQHQTSTSGPPQVPLPLTPLLGRERELAQLVSSLTTLGSRLVTITGLGGVGKSRLALAAAAGLHTFFGGRVHILPIAPNQDAGLLIGAMARTLGTSEAVAPQALAAHLAGRPTLILLDSFEFVLSAAADVEAMLLAAPELRVLTTSRERLKISGEHEIALMPLRVPEASDPHWAETPAAALFLERMRAVRPDLEVDPHLVIDICRRVSGVPLALELAAARVRHLPLAAIEDRLRKGIGDLSAAETNRPERHQSMEQTLAWSITSLTSEETLVLEIGALFPGGWRLDAAQSLCAGDVDVIGAVSGLVDKSLVFLDAPTGSGGEVPRWRMLDVVREFVREHAELHHVGNGVRTAFVSFFLRLLADVEQDLGREHEWFAVLSTEAANVRAALTWATDDGDAETVLRLSNGMWQFWQAGGQLTEGRRWLETGLSLTPSAADVTRMTALWGLGWLAYHQADDASAEAAAAEVQMLAIRHRNDQARRNALTIRGMVAISHEDAREAVTLLAEALRIARELDNDWLLATSLLNLGLGHLSLGDTDPARLVIGEALAGYERIGDERFHARCLGYLGLASLLEDDPRRARALFVQSLSAFGELGEPGGTAEGLVGLAAVDAAAGQHARAAMLAGAGERLRDSYAGRELPLEHRTNGRYLASAEVALGKEAWADAWASGRDLPLEEAIDLAVSSSLH
jgi:predicted ATPase/transcriptional regulator with XRE-family HTH domain